MHNKLISKLEINLNKLEIKLSKFMARNKQIELNLNERKLFYISKFITGNKQTRQDWIQMEANYFICLEIKIEINTRVKWT